MEQKIPPLHVRVEPGDETAGECMDFAPYVQTTAVARHPRPENIEQSIEPKRRRVDIENGEKQSDRMAQLKRDIQILEAAIQQGQQKIGRMLHTTEKASMAYLLSREQLLSEECNSMMADLTEEERAKAKEFQQERVERSAEDGSLFVDLCDDSIEDNPSSIKVESWELKKCGCDFCGIYSHRSQDGLPPRI